MKALAHAIPLLCFVLVSQASAATHPAPAANPGPPPPDPTLRAVRGPAEVDLTGLGTVTVPRGCFFTDADGGRRLLDRTGQRVAGKISGLLAPQDGAWIAWLELRPEVPSDWPSDPGVRAERILRELRAGADDTVSTRGLADKESRETVIDPDPVPAEAARRAGLSALRVRTERGELGWFADARRSGPGLLWLHVRELRPRSLSPALLREIAGSLLFADHNPLAAAPALRKDGEPRNRGSKGWVARAGPVAVGVTGMGLAFGLVWWGRRRRRLPSASSPPGVLLGPPPPGTPADPSTGAAGIEGAGVRRHRARRFDYDRFYYDLFRDL